MANRKLTDLTELLAPADGDFVYIVDVSDTTESPQGTSKKIKKHSLLTSDNISNNSDVEGETVTEALNNLYPGEIVNEADFIATVEADGTLAKIDPVNLPWILKDDFYKNTDVNYPADITFRPFEITEQNGIFKTDFGVDDIVKDKISKMKPYYCNYETGSDSNDGLTEATAVKTIAYAYTTLGARLLYLTGGIHKSDSWNQNINASYANTDDFFVIALKPTYVTSAGTATPVLISGSAYRLSGGSYRTLVDMKYVDEKGFPLRLTEVATAADVLTTPGSYFIDIAGSTIDFRLLDSRVPDSRSLALTRSGANYRANAGYHYVKGITFMGGGVNGTHGVESQTTASTCVGLAKSCQFLYGYGTGYNSTGGEGFRTTNNLITISEDCIAYGNARDGFNYNASSATRMGVFEINNQSFFNGTKLLSNSVNGSSGHGVSDIIRINGKYYQNSGPNVIDVDGAITANYGTTAFESIAPLANDNVDYSTSSATGTPSKQYNLKVKSYGATSFKIGDTGASYVINKDVVYKGVNVIATPGAPQTITFADFPTANVVSLALPALSAYTAKIEYAPNILTGYVSGAGTVAGTDTVLQAIQKLNGNIALGTRPYKTYSGTITQAGTGNPTLLVDENQLSGALAWTRTGVGTYTGTLVGAFISSKVRINISNNANSTPNQQIYAQRASNDTIVFQSFIGAVLTDSVLNQMFFEVRVYP